MECVVQGNVFGVTRGTSHRFLSPRRPRNGPRSKGVTVATDGFARIRAISIVRVGIANVLHRVRSSELERGACLLGTGPPGLRLPSVQGGSNQEKRRGDQQRMRCQPHPFPGPHLRHEKRLRGLACLFKTTFDLYNPTLLRGKRQTPANPENHQGARRTTDAPHSHAAPSKGIQLNTCTVYIPSRGFLAHLPDSSVPTSPDVFVFSPHFRIYADCYLFQYEGFRFIPIDASPLDLIIKTPAARVPAQASQEPPGSVA